MSILQKHLAFVKEQEAFHLKQAEFYHSKKSNYRATLHQTTAEKFSALAIDVESADKMPDAPQADQQNISKHPIQWSLTMEDIEGLPDELVKELNLSATDKTEFAITTAIEKAGGIITLSKLLIALYKDTGVIYKRLDISTRMARMANKNIIYYVPGKKGVYSIEQLTSNGVAKIFGASKPESNDEGDEA